MRGLTPRARWAYGGALLLGLAIRVASLWLTGGPDVDIFARWGERVFQHGLAHGYNSDYYPLANQLFGLAYALADGLGFSSLVAVKAFTLIADCGSLALLVHLLVRWGRSPLYALVFWLHPYFLLISIVGYVDGWLGLMLLASLAMLSARSDPRGLLLAGIPLGAAFSMKPQAIFPVLMVSAVAAVAVLQRRRGSFLPRAWLLLVGSTGFFIAYTAFFALSGSRVDFVARIYASPAAAKETPLSANMLNVWHVVASLERRAGEQIYDVTRPAGLSLVALALTAAILLWALVKLTANPGWRPDLALLLLAVFGTVVVPMTLTAAHENHLFLGALLLVLVAALSGSRTYLWLLIALLAVQAANLVGLYGLGRNSTASEAVVSWITRHYTQDVRLVAAALSTALWVAVLGGLVRLAHAQPRLAKPPSPA